MIVETRRKKNTHNDKLQGDLGLSASVFHCRLRHIHTRPSSDNRIVIFSKTRSAPARVHEPVSVAHTWEKGKGERCVEKMQ